MVDAVVTRGFVMCLDNWENWNQGDLISDQAWSYVLKKKHTQKKPNVSKCRFSLSNQNV